ncbi:MAG TPA: diguanylate cyclase, partial [Firmicutes bacterium]|nr:diguanylate cyclase [Bacillota bacterium]
IVEGKKYVICVTRDIGERKWAEEELRKSQAKFRNFVENASDIIFTVNQEGIITYISPNITTLAGYERAEVEGKHFFNLLHPGDYQLCRAFIEDVFQGKAVGSQIEYRVFYKDGTFKWHALKGSVDRGNEKDPVFIGISRNITEKKEYEEQLRYLSQHDQLTGLFNRIPLDRAMDRLEGSDEYPISFLMCDLNGLKEINDTYGHSQGDAILKATADVFRESLREEDLVARLGGDEFVVVLKKTDEEMCGQIVNRIRRQIEAHNRRCEKNFYIDLAIGSSTVWDNQKPLMKAFTEADDDMYREKRAKKGSCR